MTQVLATVVPPKRPYPGIEPFQFADQGVFFARKAEVNKLLAMPDVKAAIHAQGAEVQSMSTEQFSNLLKTDYQKWKGIVQASGATIE